MPILPNTLTEISSLSDNDNAVFPPPLSNSSFKLDSSGVVGFFGGDSSVAGMATVNLIPGRRWGGWYNTPGSYEIAKQYGPLGNLTLCDGLFPGREHDPARLFRIDGNEGPQFIGVHSGTILPHTGHLGYLITSWAKDLKSAHKFDRQRSTTSTGVTIVNLHHIPKESEHPHLPTCWTHSAYFSLVPILVSVGACVVCALVADWFCFASIAVGIVAHGSACHVIGSGKLTFKHPMPAKDAPRGDGVLKGDGAVVILVGAQGAVNTFTRGRFHLQYGAQPSDKGPGDHHYELGSNTESRPPVLKEVSGVPQPLQSLWSSIRHLCQWFSLPPQGLIGLCALLLTGQFLVQLLLIPTGTLFGQLMFIATVVASWAYNTHLSSINREKIQTKILFSVLDLNDNLDSDDSHVQNYRLDTWTATVAFTSFVLASVHRLDDPLALLDAMLSNNTVVWRMWKEKMAMKLKDRQHFDQDVVFKFTEEDLVLVDGKDRGLLDTLFRDAENAWHAWSEVRNCARMIALRNQQEAGE